MACFSSFKCSTLFFSSLSQATNAPTTKPILVATIPKGVVKRTVPNSIIFQVNISMAPVRVKVSTFTPAIPAANPFKPPIIIGTPITRPEKPAFNFSKPEAFLSLKTVFQALETALIPIASCEAPLAI
jgi:hypothetical protein